MAGEFNLIQVHADDEDVVIKAGVGAEREPEGEQLPERGQTPVPADAVAEEAVEAHAVEQPAPSKPVKKEAPRPRKETYRETTLEDLQSEKMPTAQKVVIIAAVICIIGALAYYFLFMR